MRDFFLMLGYFCGKCIQLVALQLAVSSEFVGAIITISTLSLLTTTSLRTDRGTFFRNGIDDQD